MCYTLPEYPREHPTASSSRGNDTSRQDLPLTPLASSGCRVFWRVSSLTSIIHLSSARSDKFRSDVRWKLPARNIAEAAACVRAGARVEGQCVDRCAVSNVWCRVRVNAVAVEVESRAGGRVPSERNHQRGRAPRDRKQLSCSDQCPGRGARVKPPFPQARAEIGVVLCGEATARVS